MNRSSRGISLTIALAVAVAIFSGCDSRDDAAAPATVDDVAPAPPKEKKSYYGKAVQKAEDVRDLTNQRDKELNEAIEKIP